MVTPEGPNTNNRSAAAPTETADTKITEPKIADHAPASSMPKDTGSGTCVPDNNPDNNEANVEKASSTTTRAKEIGGQKGPEPTRYGDWEKNGRCTDF